MVRERERKDRGCGGSDRATAAAGEEEEKLSAKGQSQRQEQQQWPVSLITDLISHASGSIVFVDDATSNAHHPSLSHSLTQSPRQTAHHQLEKAMKSPFETAPPATCLRFVALRSPLAARSLSLSLSLLTFTGCLMCQQAEEPVALFRDIRSGCSCGHKRQSAGLLVLSLSLC